MSAHTFGLYTGERVTGQAAAVAYTWPDMDLHFGPEDRKFLYRVAGVAIRGGKVLIHSWEGQTAFFCLPGGRVSMGEPAAAAIAREMREELACEVRVGRLLWLIENLFTHNGIAHHEIGLYFEITLPEGVPQASGEAWTGHEEDGSEMYFRWQPLDRLGEIDLKPSCLKSLLMALPEHTEYVLHGD